MKRVYSNQNKNKKKAELRKLVLAQLSKMRKKMKKEHPGMLEKMRDAMDSSKKSKPVKPSHRPKPNEEQVDQSKNIEAVEKMLALKNGNASFEKAVRTMLSNKKN